MASNREEPPSKKRVSARQITKEDDPDSEGEDGSMQGGTFRRASSEVLAERRIVKVRRTPVPSSTPNPFAAIKLVPPSTAPASQESAGPPSFSIPPLSTNSVSNPGAADGEGKSSAPALDGGVADNSDQATSTPVEVAVEKTIVVTEVQPSMPVLAENNDLGLGIIDSNAVAAGDVAESGSAETTELVKETVISVEKEVTNNDNKSSEEQEKASESESVGPSGASSETFQQLSGTKNAFAGSFGTGFGTTPFIFNTSSTPSSQPSSGFASFGTPFTSSSQPFGSSLSFGQSLFGTKSSSAGAFPSLSSVFGKSNGSAGTPLFGSAAPAAAAPTTGAPSPAVVSLQEVTVETGEEKEKAVFTADASLFEFIDGGWKERGKGELRVNVSEEKDKRPRLVMRSKGNYRLLLNASLFPDMKLSKMDNRGISFVCANSAAEGRTGLTTYAVKVKDAVVASEFSQTVQAHKQHVNSEPRTPESSPKATERPAKVVETSEV